MKDKTIKFDPPLEFDGAESIAEVTMREPKVKDMKHMDSLKGSDLEVEVAMIGRLTGINPEDLDTLSVSHYRQLQNEYASFFDQGGQGSGKSA